MNKVIRTVKKDRDTKRDYVSGPMMQKSIEEWYLKEDKLSLDIACKAIVQICTNLSTKRNFRNYSYLDEMVSEGIVMCTSALIKKKYDLAYANPFAYFSQVAHNAFVTIIKKEHKQAYIKHKEYEDYRVTAALRGEKIESSIDDSGRIDKLVNQFETHKNLETPEENLNE